MSWQNLVFAFVTPIVLAALIALIISGLVTSLLWVAAHGENSQIGHAFGALLGSTATRSARASPSWSR